MLPGDIKACKKKAELSWQAINSHLIECKLTERAIPYSDKLFKKAAIEWLVATDQVCLFSYLCYLYTVIAVV